MRCPGAAWAPGTARACITSTLMCSTSWTLAFVKDKGCSLIRMVHHFSTDLTSFKKKPPPSSDPAGPRSSDTRNATFLLTSTIMSGPEAASCRWGNPRANKIKKQPSKYRLNFHSLSSTSSVACRCSMCSSAVHHTAPTGSVSSCPIWWSSLRAASICLDPCSFSTPCRTITMDTARSLNPCSLICCSSESRKRASSSHCRGNSNRHTLRSTITSSTRCGRAPAVAAETSRSRASLVRAFSSGGMPCEAPRCCHCLSTTFLLIRMASSRPCGSTAPSA
mmetsp:Transcript_16875/g.47876  ORF Transcript_16875/g.47876 Transcript_16875/m.47876 type:complete len:278 (+) Transcript_16875:837-1670(+)